jgi:hypothetical protein
MAVIAVTAPAPHDSAAGADLGRPVAEACLGVPQARYFPDSASRRSELDLFTREWYSGRLVAMGEPSLSCGGRGDAEAYRFLWIPAFRGSIAVRVFRRRADYGLEAVILDGAGGNFRPGKVSRRVTKELSRDQWQTVIARLEDLQLWQMPTVSHDPWAARDGAQWIIEARRDGRYHVMDRSEGSDDLQSVGGLFLDLAGLSDLEAGYGMVGASRRAD